MRVYPLAVLGLWVLAATLPASAADRRIRVENGGSVDLVSLRARPQGGDWRAVALPAPGLAPGQGRVVSLEDGSGACDYDFQAAYVDGASAETGGVDVCRESVVILGP